VKIEGMVYGVLLLIVLCVTANGEPNKRIVLVPPFENHSSTKSIISYEVATNPQPGHPKRYFAIDRYSEAPRGLVEDLLVGSGVEVVERQRIDQLLLEADASYGIVNTEDAIRLGKMLGANTILMGTILNIQTRQNTFSGYGIQTSATVTTCSIRVRVIDIESGIVIFSKIYSGQTSSMRTQYGADCDSDAAYTVIEDAIRGMHEDLDFTSLFGKGPI
jgi:hypothetical protein